MRLGRIASPDGVAFVSIEGDPARGGVQRDRRASVRHTDVHRAVVAACGRATARADPGQQGGVHGQELRRPCRGDGRRRARGSGDLPQAQHRDHRAEHPHPVACRRQPGPPRGGVGRGDRPAVQGRARRTGGGEHPRLHHRQRRVGTRSAAQGRPVDAGEGPRHLLPGRAMDRHRPRPESTWICVPRSTANCANTPTPR